MRRLSSRSSGDSAGPAGATACPGWAGGESLDPGRVQCRQCCGNGIDCVRICRMSSLDMPAGSSRYGARISSIAWLSSEIRICLTIRAAPLSVCA